MITGTISPKWSKTISHGIPYPRYFSPLVMVNKQMQEAEEGYKLNPKFLPPTILQLDECEGILRVNEAQIDLKGFLPEMRIAHGAGTPAGIPSSGYLPFYINTNNNKLYAYAGSSWRATT